jgi:aminoglycoside phosphotransferase (APT) family kinase protein
MEPGPLIGQGREAETFAWDEGRVLRLMRDRGAGEWAELQLAAMRAAWESGVPVPEPGERVTVRGRPGIVMERATGPDLLTLMGSQPWKVFWVARTLGRVHAQMHEVVAPASLPPLRLSLRERIGRAEPLTAKLRRFALEVLDGLPDGDRLCHGDFHPGNLLLSARGPLAIDWTLATRGDPTGDFARQPLMLRLGSVPPGTPVLLRYGQRFGRGVFLRTYLRAYRRHQSVDDAAWSRWQIVQAAARPAEGIESEYPALIRFLESRASG